MKFSTSCIAILATLAQAAAYSPVRISYEALENGTAEDVLRQALTEVGMISITHIPSFQSNKMETLKLLPKCMDEASNDDQSTTTASTTTIVEHTFGDGTRRRTMATHNVGTSASSSLLVPQAAHDDNDDDHSSSSSSKNHYYYCQEFQAVSQSFRETVGHVMDTFANELAIALDLDASKTLLREDDDNKNNNNDDGQGGQVYNLRNIFGQGEQLEHFHCYYKDNEKKNDTQEEEETIEWHTDQGLVLAFTPGLIDGEPTEGFHVQLKDGSTEMVDFDHTDDLVFLMGDGVNQYVNGALLEEEENNKPLLRALPHALQMPSTTTEDLPRVWYGRMVLPPPNAKHPTHPSMTFGEIRQDMIAEDTSSIGCSHNLVARELQDTTCEEGLAAYCWHRCMNLTDYGVSDQICEEQNKTLACMNDEGYLWPYTHDMQFKLGCASPDAVNWTTVTDDSDSDNTTDHGGDENKNHTGNSTTVDVADSSTSTLLLGTSLLLGTVMSAIFSFS
ncbi:unnamed protein product [Cylindrotheca closterium]|uniref:Fe2OG dioxygenase domain-containing protein n=1 Tax=Cylindrotheca closterium TaxID=2856 RepID=A0AAD2G7Y3_9STRA|nr:unnamed protein product [Cylindrotheca closterium]